MARWEVVFFSNTLRDSDENSEVDVGWGGRELPSTLRMELSCRVFFVSYPSSRQQRTVEPEPANSARFRSAKPSCEGKRLVGSCRSVGESQEMPKG